MFHYNNVVAAYHVFVCVVSRAGRQVVSYLTLFPIIIHWSFLKAGLDKGVGPAIQLPRVLTCKGHSDVTGIIGRKVPVNSGHHI
jgi:hypothetical protein